MVTSFPKFSKLNTNHKTFIDKIFETFPPYSDHTFSSLHSWNIDDKVEICELYGNCVVKLNDYLTNESFLSFIGNNRPAETVESLLNYAKSDQMLLSQLKLIPEHNLVNLELDNEFEITEDPDNYDYIYSIDELAELKGNKYRGKRNFVNRFSKLYKWEVLNLNLDDDKVWEEMQNLYHRWSEKQNEKENDIQNESRALNRIRESMNLIPLYSLGLRVENKMDGYSINELHNQGFATNLFEHADTNFTGVFPFLKMQTAIKLKELGYKYLSHQQDLGLEGLRKSKKAYYPTLYLKKYSIRKIDK